MPAIFLREDNQGLLVFPNKERQSPLVLRMAASTQPGYETSEFEALSKLEIILLAYADGC